MREEYNFSLTPLPPWLLIDHRLGSEMNKDDCPSPTDERMNEWQRMLIFLIIAPNLTGQTPPINLRPSTKDKNIFHIIRSWLPLLSALFCSCQIVRKISVGNLIPPLVFYVNPFLMHNTTCLELKKYNIDRKFLSRWELYIKRRGYGYQKLLMSQNLTRIQLR